MKLIILTGGSNSPIAINPNTVLGIRECKQSDSEYKTCIDTNNFTYKVQEDFVTVCNAIKNV